MGIKRSGQENSGEDSQGTEGPKESLFHRLMDEVIVRVVGLQWEKIGSFRWTLEEVGVPKKVRAVSDQGGQPPETEGVEFEPGMVPSQHPGNFSMRLAAASQTSCCYVFY